MKTPLFCLACLVCISTSASAVDPVTVSASTAVRIAWLETRSNLDRQQLETAFQPLFRRSLARVYGEETPIEFIRLNVSRTVKAMAEGEVDAVLVFGSRMPRQLAAPGTHVLSAAAIEPEDQIVARLILLQAQPRLDELIATAFSTALNNFDVRRLLGDKVPDDWEVASW